MIKHCLRILVFTLFVSFGSYVLSEAVQAPEISDGLVWINSSRPLKIEELKGKFVVVYFWSYGLSHFQGLVEQCRELQEKFPSQLVVIGVHTGKALDNDVLNDRVADAVGSFRIKHPVVVDDQMKVLRDFRLERLPSAVLLAPDGKVLFKKTESTNLFYLFSRLIQKNIPRFESRLDLSPLNFQEPQNAAAVLPDQDIIAPENPEYPEKVMQPPLLSNIALDPKNETQPANPSSEANAVPAPETSLPDEPVDFEVQDAEPEITKAPLDVKTFSGERVHIDREYSRKIGLIKFDFHLGTGADLLPERKSFVRVYTEDSAVIAQQFIGDLRFDLTLNSELPFKKLYIEGMFYYCTHGQRALCLMKNVLFVVPLADYPKSEDIVISYRLPEKEP